MYGELFLSYMM